MPRFPIFNVRSEIVEDDKTANRTFYSFCLSIWKILNSPSAKISQPAGGSTVDSEARTAINKLIKVMEEHGFIKE